MAAECERPLLSVDGVSVNLSLPLPVLGDGCTVELHKTKMDLVSGSTKVSLPFSAIKTIDLHQPIFGANYIVGEYIYEERRHSFTLTFKRGGATDFTRLLFRLTEGELQQGHPGTVTEVSVSQAQTTEDKKNR